MAKPGFFEELKRRHVWRVAIAYAVVGWLIVQIATQVFPFFNIPDWGARLVVILVVIGFPAALALAWAFEFTPGGIRRTEPADSPNARPHDAANQVGHKLNTVIIAVLIIAIALLGWRLLVLRQPTVSRSTVAAASTPRPAAASAEPAATKPALVAKPAAFNPSADSIMVLPFTNLSDDPKQTYFSNGITEELTGALGQNTGLSVIAWNTASKYAGSKQTPDEIGKALNVAHVLAGSIQRAGDRVRVSAELISTVDGRQLWSAHYDDTQKNLFAVEDRISAAIADALQVKFAGMRNTPTLDPTAHDLYLKGLAALDRATAADAQAAQRYFEQALELDPDYADAWAGLARNYVWLSTYSTLPLGESMPKLRAAAHKALALDPRNVSALVALGDADLNDHRIAEAREKFTQALKLDPNNSAAHFHYGLVLPLKPSLSQYREAARLDPGNAMVHTLLSVHYSDLADWPRMAAAAKALNKAAPNNFDAAFFLAFAYTEMQRGEDAVTAFDLVQPANPLDKQLLDAGRLTYRALLQPSLRTEALAALDRLRKVNNSPAARADLIQSYLALGEKETATQMLPILCTAAPVACNDIAINPTYVSLRGDRRFAELARRYSTTTLD